MIAEIRDWMATREAITRLCSRIQISSDVSKELPRIMLSRVSDPRGNDFEGQSNARTPRIQIDIFTAKGSPGEDIAAAIEDELPEMRGLRIAGRTVVDCDLENEFDRLPGAASINGATEGTNRLTQDWLLALQ